MHTKYWYERHMKRDQFGESILHVEMRIEFSRLRGESNGGY